LKDRLHSVRCGSALKKSPKILLIFLLLLFFSVLIIIAVASVVPWSSIPGIAGAVEMLLSAALGLLVLAVVFYLRTQGSARQLRAFWTIAFGFMIAFPFAIVTSLALEVFLGVPRGSLFEILCLVGLGIGMVLGWHYGKEETKEESHNLDLS
jgi:hypothetical protein